MIQLLKTKLGRLRVIGFLEGISLLTLVFIAMPMKYIGNDPTLTTTLGPVHGALFLLFLFSTLSVAIEQNWSFRAMTWKVMAACFIPFGTFYIDYKFLRKR
jgi:integral membrane protein